MLRLTNVPVEVPQKKPYDVMYKVRTLQEIMEMQSKEIKKIQTLLELPVSLSTPFVCLATPARWTEWLGSQCV